MTLDLSTFDDRQVTAVLTASAGPVNLDFPCFVEDGGDLIVTVDGVVKTRVTDWTFSGTLETGFYRTPQAWVNGSVTFTTVQTGTVVVKSVRQPSRGANFSEGQGVPARDLNFEQDRSVAVQQELRRDIDDYDGRLEAVEAWGSIDLSATAESITAGSPATATVTDATPPSVNFHFGIPIGATGAPGPASNRFTTTLAMQNASVEASVLLAAVDGDTVTGVEPGLYRRVASEPSHAYKLRSTDRYLPNGTTNATNGGWWEQLLLKVTDPPAGAVIYQGGQVALSNSDGTETIYTARKTFAWSELYDHILTADPDMVLAGEPAPGFGEVVKPTGFLDLPFDCYYGGDRIETSVDEDAAFRAAFLDPIGGWDNVFYVTDQYGDDANDGRSWATAKKTISGTGGGRDAINTSAAPAVMFVEGKPNGGQYGRLGGVSHSSLVNYDYAMIGVPNRNDGTPLILGNSYDTSESAFAAASTDAGSDAVITAIDIGSNPPEITITGTLPSDGQRVAIYDVVGTTEANGVWIVDNASGSTFDLHYEDGTGAVDCSAWTSYTSGGKVAENFWYEMADTVPSQPGNAHDLTRTTPELMPDGSILQAPVPMEYVDNDTALMAKPGRIFHDSANNLLKVNMVGGVKPVFAVNLAVMRSTIDIFCNTTGVYFYGENIVYLGSPLASGYTGSAYWSKCAVLEGRTNGLGTEAQINFGKRKCLIRESGADGLNQHNVGTNVGSMVYGSPTLINVSTTAGMVTGQTWKLAASAWGGSIGPDALLGDHVVTVISPTQLSIPVDSTGFPAYTPNLAKVRLLSSDGFALDCIVRGAGAINASNQATSAHENVRLATINGKYSGAGRNDVVDIGDAEHQMYHTSLGGMKIAGTPGGGNPRQHVLMTDGAKLAMYECDVVGRGEAGVDMVGGSTIHPIRIQRTRLPPGGRVSNATQEW